MSETQEKQQDLSGVTLLGSNKTRYLTEYDPTVLERFKLVFDTTEEEQVISLDCFEFVSRCPKTGQPDYATMYISYIPGPSGYAVESKSLKIYLGGYCMSPSFHESCTHQIMEDLVKLLDPRYLEVYGDFNSRGGVSILPLCIYADEEHQDMKKARQIAMMQHCVSHTPRPRR